MSTEASAVLRAHPPAARTAARLGSALHHPLSRPLAALALLLLIAFFSIPGFFQLEIKDGHLYGSLIDILNRAAPLMLAALGMTLVIATRGIDVSVGAVVAISGTVAAVLVAAKVSLALALAGAIGAALLCGIWNGLLVAGLGLQPIIATLLLMVAGRGLAQLFTDGQIITVYEPASFFYLGSGWLLGLPFSLFVVAAVFGLTALLLWCAAATYALAQMARGSSIRSRGGGRHGHGERGDVPGWVLITLMTAGIVAALWVVAQEQLLALFSRAINSVSGHP